MKTNNKTIINILSKIKVMSANEQFLNVVINNGTVYLAHEQGYIELKTELSPDLYGRIPLKRFIDLLKNKIDITQSNLTQDLNIYTPIKNEIDDNFKNTVSFDVDKEFLNLFDFISKDYLRPAMTGVYLSDKICATNAHILKTIKKDTFKDYNIILPSIALKLLSIGVYSVSHNSRYIEFKNENSTFVFCLLTEKYPNFKAVIPQKNDKVVIFSKKQLLSELKKCSVFYNKTTKIVIFDIKKESVCINAVDIDFNRTYKNELSAKIESLPESIEIGFNAGLLETIIKNIDMESIVFSLQAPDRAALINETSLIMPALVRI